MTVLDRSMLTRFARTAMLLGTLTLAASCSTPQEDAPAASEPEQQAAAAEAKPSEPAKPANTHPVVIIETTLGTMEAELYEDKAPISVANFLAYTGEQHYDGTIFHRVIKGFMIQGGGFTVDGNKKPTKEPIKNEADNGLKNLRGTLAMARTGVVDSATNQFFINDSDNAFLDHRAPTSAGFGYAVFGKVIAGMDVLDNIAGTPTQNRGGAFAAAPVDTVEIKSIRLKTAG